MKQAFLAVLFAISLVPATAWSWSELGHSMTGAIADQLLDAKAKAAVADLLADDLNARGRPSHRTSLAAVANWADEIRPTRASRPDWHYDKRPVCAAAGSLFVCPPGSQCNTAQIEERRRILADPAESKRSRNEALKWLVHLVGDIHQPLHAAENRDAGGNGVRVSLVDLAVDENSLVLHHVWDRQFVLLAFDAGFNDELPGAAKIAPLVPQAEALLMSRGVGNAESWAKESNAIARDVAHHYEGFACGKKAKKVALNAEYQRNAAAQVRERVLLGGARLAELLNQTLGNGGS